MTPAAYKDNIQGHSRACVEDDRADQDTTTNTNEAAKRTSSSSHPQGQLTSLGQ